MKLFITCGALECGGAERVLSVLSGSFADNYKHVTIMMWVDAPIFYEIDSRIRLLSIEKECGSKNIFKKMFWFRCYVFEQKPDLLLSFLTPFNMLSLTALLGWKSPIVVAERNDPRYLKGGTLMKIVRNLLYHRVKGILTQTENNKCYFKGSLYRKTDVIYNPVFMKQNYIGTALRCEKKMEIVSVGRLVPQKNQKMLIYAFKRFHDRRTDSILTIYGEGIERAALADLIVKENLSNCVFLPGTEEHLFDRINSAEMFILSSSYEGMPNALIEAMCLGLPCISTKVSGAVDLINDGENGLLVDIDDTEMMTNAMLCLVSDKEYAKTLAENASVLYSELSVEVISKKWINYINNIVR